MQIKDVAAKFDTTPVYDAYTGALLPYRCQVTLWDNPRRDGLTTLRRTISGGKGFQLPPRRAVVIGSQAWIGGTYMHPDTFDADVVRVGCVIQFAELGGLGTSREFLDMEPTPVYLSKVWIKDVKDISTTSESQGQYNIYYTEGENVQEGEFLYIQNRMHIVRNCMKGAGGLWIAEVNELEPECFQEISFGVEGEYDPIMDEYVGGDVKKANVIVLRWNDDYEYELPSHEKYQVGDIRMRVKVEESPVIGDDVTYLGDVYTVVSVTERADSVNSVVIRRK